MQNGVAISHAARQVTKQDYYDFDYILGADTQNLENLKRRKPDDSKAKVALFGSFIDGEPEAISDPYYGGTVRVQYTTFGIRVANWAKINSLERFQDMLQAM